MILSIATTYKKHIAAFLSIVFYLQLTAPLYARALSSRPDLQYRTNRIAGDTHMDMEQLFGKPLSRQNKLNDRNSDFSLPFRKSGRLQSIQSWDMGGPSSPEASSFKPVGSSNLVNLFTGDFSYSVPLMDVGGYPVNLFYNGGITMDQEASWVGLGWNINPGSVSRNMRGVPDDFDGTDTLIQTQNTKPNRTWGGEVGVDGELMGIKEPKIGLSLGFSYNNYLGPAFETGATVSVSLPIQESITAEKSASQNIGVSLGAKLSSRSGLTLSPSLNASLPITNSAISAGIGLSTSYNSRSGISSINLHSELSMYRENSNNKLDEAYKSNGVTSPLNKIGSSTISFSKPSYMPSMRMPMQNSYTSGQVELGGGAFGFRGSATLDGYYSESKVPAEWQVVKKPLVGFIYSEKANNNVNAVMDLNRLNDAEVTPNTPIISAPIYTYDIFSIQGEGTGGTIRAYRGDLGFMRDNVTLSKDANISIGADIAPPGHYGLNVNKVSAPTRVGGWENNNNTLRQTMQFSGKALNSSFENVYFRSPGESTVTNDELLSRIGRDSLVRFLLSGSTANPRIESQLELFNKKTGTANGTRTIAGNTFLQNREKRAQITTMLTAKEASVVGMERNIRNYRTGTALFDANDNHIVYDTIPRFSAVDYRKDHHISEVDVLEQNGMRYVYGIPVYSVKQKDFTFTVGNVPADVNTNIVQFDPSNDVSLGSFYMTNKSAYDGYLQIQETPAYASSFLITGLLSPDYVDVTGDGITEDDLGGAVKFNYSKSTDNHKWRTPRDNGTAATAHFNEGKRSEKRDNKATISYGEREAWYLNSIESKAMIAIFKTSTRNDAKGVVSELNGGANAGENANKLLNEIDLYTKADIKANGIAGAKPIKSVFFYYSYSLCNGTPDNPTGAGKLTLDSLMFSYNGQGRLRKEKYAFNYGNTSSKKDNSGYMVNASDRWGVYKPVKDSSGANVNPNGLNNIDYPFTSANKAADDQFAAAWSLKKILLPSGGQMEINYEADDYAYVQDRRACNMFNLYGLGNSPNFTTDNYLYTKGSSGADNLYVYVKLPQPLINTDPVKRKAEIFSKYLETLNQVAFKLQVNMPKGVEPLTVFATGYDDYGLCANSVNNDIIYIKMTPLNGGSPLAKSAISFLIENLTGQAFPGYDAGVNTLPDFLGVMGSMLSSITNAFNNAENQMRSDGKARTIVLANSFVRLDNPVRIKYGGGYRVKRVLVKDNWSRMTHQYTSTYGQDYDYTTSQTINGKDSVYSSGVASYEPGIGGEENPFREILNFSNKLPLASAQYGAIEMPMLEALYPSSMVGYSKVTVRSIHRKGTHGDSTLRSAIGKQVTEFFTAKDYPSYNAYTPMVSMDYKKDPFFSFFNKEVINRRMVSQGFLVETNDMHGKMKSQSAYSESDEKTPISYSYHSYKNTGKNGLNDKVDFVYNQESGAIHSGNMGVDMELMTDVREFSMESNGLDVMGQVDIFFIGPFVISIPTVFPTKTFIENKYRAVTCTKLINYHAIEDSVIVMDKGSVISTKTIAYDAETGSPIVTQTANEFNDPIFNISYPAWWAYSGIAPAYKNVGMQFSGVNFSDGRIISGVTDLSVFESGDELYISNTGTATTCPVTSLPPYKIWAYDKNKNNTALTNPVKDLIFIDSVGKPLSLNAVNFKILRSGHRNNLGLTVSSATAMKTPVQTVAGIRKLIVDNTDNIVSASAISFKEKWQTDNDVIIKRLYYTPVCSAAELDSIDCSGILEKRINPYVKGLLGNFKPYRTYAYYGLRNESDPTSVTSIRKNGYISNFSNFWGFNGFNNLVPDLTNTNWVWNSELTRINGKGQELETKDALNRYTAAQYGFNKNLPVTMTQNARYGESFSENFEDYLYSETLNKARPYTCNRNYIDLSGQYGTSIFNTDLDLVRAHSGKYVLSVNPGTQALEPLNVAALDSPGYNLNFGADTSKVLNVVGGTANFASTGGTYLDNPALNASFLSSAMAFGVRPGTATFHHYTINGYTYIQITATGTYNFSLSMGNAYSNRSLSTIYSDYFDVYIYDLNNNQINYTYLSTSSIATGSFSTQYSVTLCPGIYKIVADASELYQQGTNPDFSSNYYNWQCTNCGSQDYQSLSTQNGCISTKPIAGKDSMINKTFALVPGEKMHFSGWVRERCDSVVCYKPTYISNHVELQFPGSGAPNVILKTSGAIIDGWQKIEGDFTVPANATSANLVFSNDGTQQLYVDDVRIHPFNANMKSYVYDTRTLRLIAEMDENNYGSYYEYDEEGQLIRVKKETIQGIKTIKETRSAKQQVITEVQ